MKTHSSDDKMQATVNSSESSPESRLTAMLRCEPEDLYQQGLVQDIIKARVEGMLQFTITIGKYYEKRIDGFAFAYNLFFGQSQDGFMRAPLGGISLCRTSADKDPFLYLMDDRNGNYHQSAVLASLLACQLIKQPFHHRIGLEAGNNVVGEHRHAKELEDMLTSDHFLSIEHPLRYSHGGRSDFHLQEGIGLARAVIRS